jgi:hypothetical protein
MNKKEYVLEPDLVEHGRYYIQEHTADHVRTAIVVYYDFDLAQRIFHFLREENKKSV